MNAFSEKFKRKFPRNRYFFSQTMMRNYRWLESVLFSRAKREKKEIKTCGAVCGCGCGPFPVIKP